MENYRPKIEHKEDNMPIQTAPEGYEHITRQHLEHIINVAGTDAEDKTENALTVYLHNDRLPRSHPKFAKWEKRSPGDEQLHLSYVGDEAQAFLESKLASVTDHLFKSGKFQELNTDEATAWDRRDRAPF